MNGPKLGQPPTMNTMTAGIQIQLKRRRPFREGLSGSGGCSTVTTVVIDGTAHVDPDRHVPGDQSPGSSVTSTPNSERMFINSFRVVWANRPPVNLSSSVTSASTQSG